MLVLSSKHEAVAVVSSVKTIQKMKPPLMEVSNVLLSD